MCGRFSLDKKAETLEARFKAKLNLEGLTLPLYNIAPSQSSPCLVKDEIRPLIWGLASNMNSGKSRSLINARAETILEKWPFKSLISNRCLVLASGYFEWKTIGKFKIPFLHKLVGEEVFAMAGLYEIDPTDHSMRYTILTKPAGQIAGELHDRMPLILDRESEKKWLETEHVEARYMQDLIHVPEPPLHVFSVSSRLNKSFENKPEWVMPEKYQVPEQLSLF